VVLSGIAALQKEPGNENTSRKKTMITLDAFLVFVGAASLPVIYILLLSRWLEPEYRRAYGQTAQTAQTPSAAGTNATSQRVLQPA
jgi:hypothetical protein